MKDVIMPAQITDWSAALMASLATAMTMFFSALPKIIGFAAILIIGWILAAVAAKAIAAVLHAVKFNSLADRSGFSDVVGKMGTKTDSSGMIAGVAKWFVRLITLVVAFDALGLPAVSDVLRQVLLWMPNAVVAVLVLVIGGLGANALSKIVQGAAAEGGLSNPTFLAKVASGLVWSFAILIAVNQLGIATSLINILFMAVVGAMALALGLSFGLGGRETAGEIVRSWYKKGQANAGRISDASTAAGEIARKLPDQPIDDAITRH